MFLWQKEPSISIDCFYPLNFPSHILPTNKVEQGCGLEEKLSCFLFLKVFRYFVQIPTSFLGFQG